MKAILAVLFIAAAVIPTLPQRANHTQQNRVSLDLGPVTVWLGMPKTEFLSVAKEAGYKTTDFGVKEGAKENDVVMSSGEKITGTYYSLRFNKAGLLTYADRRWPDDDKSPYEAVMGALNTVDGQKCTVSRQPLSEPNYNLDRIFLFCDKSRSILLTYGRVHGFDASGEVSERIEAE
jgi:hypothetical protein